MREAGIRSQTKKAFKVTTKPGGLTEADDLVQRQFHAERPGELWVSDITYIRTKERWLYLAAVVDLYNREVVGWALERRVGQELVLSALNTSSLIPYAHFTINARIFLYALAIAVFFGLLSGVYPAWRMSRLHPVQALKGASR